MKTIGILQPGYLPWLGYFEQMARADVFVHYDDVQFDKGGWRNRNRIKTAAGVQFLTVPVLTKGKEFPLIRDVRINNAENWRKKHVSALRQSYGKAAFFHCYAESVFSLIEAPREFLLDLDLALIAFFREALGITTPVLLASELGIGGRGAERLIAIIEHLQGDRFYEGAAGRKYIEDELFAAHSIALEYQEYMHPAYPQLHGGFVPYLSIVDLLFTCGPESLNILRRTPT